MKDGQVKVERQQDRPQNEDGGAGQDTQGNDPVAEDETMKEQIVRDILAGNDAETRPAQAPPEPEAEEETPTDAEPEAEEEPVSISAGRLEELRQQAGQAAYYMGRYQRARADYVNLQNRVERERESWTEFATRDLATSLLGVLDNLQLALNAEAQDQNLDAFVEGVRMIEQQLYKALAEHQIEPIDAEGKEFDPQYHDAVLQEEVDGGPGNIVLEELQRGFTIRGKVLRPTKVKVSARRETAEPRADREDA